MSIKAPPTVVCFDLGGVLVKICRSWPEACQRASLPVREATTFDSQAWRVRRKHQVDRYQRGELTCAAYYAALSESLGGLYTVDEAERIHQVWTVEEYPGVLELVCALETLPAVTTACLSNTNHAHWQRLIGADGREEYPSVIRLRHRLASHELGCIKPDEQIYVMAERIFSEAAGGARPRVIFFDDLAENVAAASRIGWTAHQIDPDADPPRQIRAHLLSSGIRV